MVARRIMDEGHSVITQKFIQTGNNGFSEDIDVHRRIMGTGMFPEDIDHTTAPVISLTHAHRNSPPGSTTAK